MFNFLWKIGLAREWFNLLIEGLCFCKSFLLFRAADLTENHFSDGASLKQYLRATVLSLSPFTQSGPYSAFTTSATIPFNYSDDNAVVPFTRRNLITVTVGSGAHARTFRPIVDTGTCGFMISAAELPPVHPPYTAGWEYLSSSKKLYSGKWITKDVFFVSSTGIEIKATFPILAVEDVKICIDYQPFANTSLCPTPEGPTKHMPTGIQLMGIGFGRQRDGQPQGNPDKNPFLNIQTINGIDVSSICTFRNGYIISKEGITVGLTDSNTAGATFTDLEPGLTHASDPRDWLPLPCYLAIDAAACVQGSAVIDTGISQSYMTVPTDMEVKRHYQNSPSTGNQVLVLDDDSTVHWNFGSGGVYAAQQEFLVRSSTNDETDVVPSMVITRQSNSKPPYVNTGSHFLRKWKVILDVVSGKFGFIPTE